ncbi:MAG: beta-lactamase family protein, partial [Acidobacteria bacterium]|nr:beta-lactamase family protein [Acidobacteriota bacterium]
MKSKVTEFICSLLLLALSVGITSFPLSTRSNVLGGITSYQTQSGTRRSSIVAERIKRVENGLLPPVIIRGQTVAAMNLADRMQFYKTPGLSVAVINNGQIEWARGYGVREQGSSQAVTPETLFQAASISKPVAAMAALRLVQQGKLDLDEDVNRRLTSWKLPENEFTSEKKVTVRELLSHSAGLT